MKAEGSIKQEHILEAAIKRFSHFGINKTTITEIADESGISKQSLFYYFPDKNSLVLAVAGKIIDEYLTAIEEAFNHETSVADSLFAMVDIKKNLFSKYSLLALHDERNHLIQQTPALADLYQAAREKMVGLLSALIKKGIQRNEIKGIDPRAVSRLLLDTLSAFEHCVKDNRRIPDPKEFDELFDTQKEVLQMVLNGLQTTQTENKKINKR